MGTVTVESLLDYVNGLLMDNPPDDDNFYYDYYEGWNDAIDTIAGAIRAWQEGVI